MKIARIECLRGCLLVLGVALYVHFRIDWLKDCGQDSRSKMKTKLYCESYPAAYQESR